MHYRMNNSNDYGHLRVRSNIVRLRGSQILSRVYLMWRPMLGVFPWSRYFDTNPIVLAQAHSLSQRLRPVFESAAAAVALALNAKWILWTEE